MSEFIACPYLGGNVELTDERERHIAENHPDLLPQHRDHMVETLAAPDRVAKSSRSETSRLFARRFANVYGGKYVVVVVTTDRLSGRHWVLTAYVARRLASGVPEWERR